MLNRLCVVIVLAAAVLVAAIGSSRAAPLARECNVSMPCITAGGSAVGADRGQRVVSVDGASIPVIAGRRIKWCGWWLGRHLGLNDRALWLARNWARVGSRAAGPCVGCIVVWRNHVGIVKAVDGRRIRVLSGNDGGAVRERWHSASGVIAWREI